MINIHNYIEPVQVPIVTQALSKTFLFLCWQDHILEGMLSHGSTEKIFTCRLHFPSATTLSLIITYTTWHKWTCYLSFIFVYWTVKPPMFLTCCCCSLYSAVLLLVVFILFTVQLDWHSPKDTRIGRFAAGTPFASQMRAEYDSSTNVFGDTGKRYAACNIISMTDLAMNQWWSGEAYLLRFSKTSTCW